MITFSKWGGGGLSQLTKQRCINVGETFYFGCENVLILRLGEFSRKVNVFKTLSFNVAENLSTTLPKPLYNLLATFTKRKCNLSITFLEHFYNLS